jgi:hypothetical protein
MKGRFCNTYNNRKNEFWFSTTVGWVYFTIISYLIRSRREESKSLNIKKWQGKGNTNYNDLSVHTVCMMWKYDTQHQ